VTICGGEWVFHLCKAYCWSCSLSTLHICNLRASRHHLLSYPQNRDNRADNRAARTGPQDPFAKYRRDYLALGPEFHADMSSLDYYSIRYRNRPRGCTEGQYYLALGPEFHADMSLLDYCSIKYRNRPGDAQRGDTQTQNMDFIKKVGKLNIPTFDESSRCSAKAWVQNLDTYFKLNPMMESKSIGFATLQLEGEANEWWYHGLARLGHSRITSYLKFIERLMERFDRRDPELHLRDLTQLKQTRSVEAFITEFQRKAMAVSDISKHRLVMMFIEALMEPLRGWVKAFQHFNYQALAYQHFNYQPLLSLSLLLSSLTFNICCHFIYSIFPKKALV
jgi:hypothetical protein